MIRRGALVWVLASALSLLFLASACGGSKANPFGVKSELVTNAQQPQALAFAPDGRLFYAERLTGDVRVVSADGQPQKEPFAHVDVPYLLEWGLTGLAIDPEFATNHYVYIYFTQVVEAEPRITARPVVWRFTEESNRGVDRKVIVGDLPSTDIDHPGFNANGGMHFGLDGFLYIAVGDYDVGVSQDLSLPMGKLLRVDKEDGSAPLDNPFVGNPDADPRVFAYGFRESFDFTIQPRTGQIYGNDNTPGSCEELNLIEAGGNYGWPDVGEFPWPDCLTGQQVKAIHLFAHKGMKPGDYLSTVLVVGKEVVSGDVYPLLGDSLLVCQGDETLMRRLTLAGADLDQVTADDVVIRDCSLDVTVNPDGVVYYSNDKEIRRLVPVKTEP
jgi:glucose/arabinose dehydrogenase